MEILNLSENKCWFVWLMPFNAEIRNYPDIIIPYQENCIKKRLFGLGWRDDEKNLDSIEDEWNRVEKGGYKNALYCYKRIKKGDYVITRTKNGNVYIGRVSKPAEHFVMNEDVPDQNVIDRAAKRFPYFDNEFEYVCNEKNGSGKIEKITRKYSRRSFLSFPEISYGCFVSKWFKCDINLIPSEIQGRLSQRRHPTIQAVDVLRQQILIRAMYDVVSDDKGSTNMPKIERNYGNYIRSLNYMELEDLVSYYIIENNPGYMLQPSSCKINEPKYEFRFFCPGKRPLTCQVKNQADINPSDYYNDESSFEKIYIFCGLWDKNRTKILSDDIINDGHPNITIIRHTDLYNTLLENMEFFSDRYYSYSKSGISTDISKLLQRLKECGYTERQKGHSWSKTNYSVNTESKRQLDNNDTDLDDTLKTKSTPTKDIELQYGDIIFFHGSVIFSPEISSIVITVQSAVGGGR